MSSWCSRRPRRTRHTRPSPSFLFRQSLSPGTAPSWRRAGGARPAVGSDLEIFAVAGPVQVERGRPLRGAVDPERELHARELPGDSTGLAARPGDELLILAEPPQGLDHPGVESFYRLIEEVRRDTGAAVLMVSHDLHVVMRASDRVICLNGHVCCEGSPAVVSEAPEYLALFGDGTGGALALYRHDHDHDHDHLHDVAHDHDHDHDHAQDEPGAEAHVHGDHGGRVH